MVNFLSFFFFFFFGGGGGDGDVPRSTSYCVYISQFIRFARVSSHMTDFNARNKILTGMFCLYNI